MAATHKKFSIFWFSIQTVVQLTLLMLAIRTFLPQVWTAQLAGGVLPFVACFLGMHMVMCFFEWAFHRYVLHAMVSPILERFARGHRTHHGLTPIKLQAVSEGSDRYVLNRYPILDEDQYEDSSFPVYALAAFWAFFTPMLALLQWAFPALPVMLGGYCAITLSMGFYEIFHAIEHLSFDWWKKAVEHPTFGTIWTKIYGFHHFHHANINVNEAISGFFGLPVADWAFRTYHQPRELLLQGRVASAKDFAVKPPWGFVQAIDGWARKRESRIQRELQADKPARVQHGVEPLEHEAQGELELQRKVQGK